MMNPYGYGGGTWAVGGLLMMFFGLIVLIGVILLIVWAVRQGEHHHEHGGYVQGGQHAAPPPGPQWQPTQPGMMMPGGQAGQPQHRDPALDAARERYARGEITKEQLDEITRNLGHQPH